MEEQQTVVSTVTPPRRRNPLIGQLPFLIALIVIAGLLVVCKPWQANPKAADRTVTVTGEAEVQAEPDEYVFNPQYDFKNADKPAALKASTDKINEVVAAIKKLGVADSKIKSDSNGYSSFYNDNTSTYYASLTVTVSDKAQAQKVQDYLLTTSPTGSVSPQGGFSKNKQKQLEKQARDKASKDARSKADESAANLGFEVGKIKSVSDAAGTSSIRPMIGNTMAMSTDGAMSAKAETLSAPIQQGENSVSAQISVTYYVR